MPNWCWNSIAFYQEDGGTAMLEAFHSDVQKYLNYKDPETGKQCDWIGHWLKSSRVDTDTLYTRGFLSDCELYPDHVRIDMETAWAPLPEVWDLMAEKYELAYVYISEETGCEVYVNTDTMGRFFLTRYQLNYFDIDELGLDPATLEEHGKLLRELSGETTYFDSWEDVVDTFEPLVFQFEDIDVLNGRLIPLGITLQQYDYE